VERRVRHRDAADGDRFENRGRRDDSRASDVDDDVDQAGDGFAGRELPGDRPPRFARFEAELLLKREIVDF
jgi:hypothetical protein